MSEIALKFKIHQTSSPDIKMSMLELRVPTYNPKYSVTLTIQYILKYFFVVIAGCYSLTTEH